MASDRIALLPGEIIIYILQDNRLSISDVINFSKTCKYLYKIIKNNNKFWKTKFFQRWPLLKEVYQKLYQNEIDTNVLNWEEEIKISIKTRRRLLHHLLPMSSKHYKQQDLPYSAFKEFDPLFRPEKGADPLAYYFLVDELISLITHPAVTSNLTNRYYALKVVRYLKQSHLKDKWQKFISLPPKKQTLERGATIISQWSQPERHISYSYISSLLDNIADQTKELLLVYYPDHSIFSTLTDKFTYWKDNNIDDNQWSVTETRQVINTLHEIFSEKLKFRGNRKMYYSVENSFIDRVLETKRGIPIILAIIFESVARRLGIRCEPISFPSHFLLRWKETYVSESKNSENFYIDVFNSGMFLTKKNFPWISGISRCQIDKYNTHEPATVVEVVTRLANNLEIGARQYDRNLNLSGRNIRLRSALELQHMIQPTDANKILELGRFYRGQHMCLSELITILKNTGQSCEALRTEMNIISQTLVEWQNTKFVNTVPDLNIEPKMRQSCIKYAIGLIMRQKTDGTLCVIIGWDVAFKDREEVVSALRCGIVRDEVLLEEDLKQPFYYVLTDKTAGWNYESQESLMLAPYPKWIDHSEIGRYFCAFNGTHYTPNEEKAKEYPEDKKARNELVLAQMHTSMM